MGYERVSNSRSGLAYTISLGLMIAGDPDHTHGLTEDAALQEMGKASSRWRSLRQHGAKSSAGKQFFISFLHNQHSITMYWIPVMQRTICTKTAFVYV